MNEAKYDRELLLLLRYALKLCVIVHIEVALMCMSTFPCFRDFVIYQPPGDLAELLKAWISKFQSDARELETLASHSNALTWIY